MDLLIAAIIIAGLPGSALWAIGLLVGVNHAVRRRVPDRNGARGAQRLMRGGSIATDSDAALAAAANALDLAVERGVLAVGGIVRVVQIFLRRHLIDTRLAVADRRRPWPLLVRGIAERLPVWAIAAGLGNQYPVSSSQISFASCFSRLRECDYGSGG